MLPDLRGPLSKIIPSSSISAANSEVEKCGQTAAGKRKGIPIPSFPTIFARLQGMCGNG